MQLSKVPFHILNEFEVKIIYEELGITPEKIEHNLKLIREWLRSENHLPSEIDEDLLKNFIIKCKGNIGKTKDKLERFIIAKTQMPYFFSNRSINDVTDPYMTHRAICVTRKLTPNGNRIMIIRFPARDPSYLDESRACKYFVLLFEALLYQDKCAGYHFVFDASNANMQVIGKVNLTNMKHLLELMYMILPFRVRSVHILNGNVAFDMLLNIAKILMSKKLKERIFSAKGDDLPKYFPKECLPADYGGSDECCDQLCEEWFSTLKENREWCDEAERLKLEGPLPEKLKELYSFEDFDMGGSFRKLEMD